MVITRYVRSGRSEVTTLTFIYLAIIQHSSPSCPVAYMYAINPGTRRSRAPYTRKDMAKSSLPNSYRFTKCTAWTPSYCKRASEPFGNGLSHRRHAAELFCSCRIEVTTEVWVIYDRRLALGARPPAHDARTAAQNARTAARRSLGSGPCVNAVSGVRVTCILLQNTDSERMLQAHTCRRAILLS